MFNPMTDVPENDEQVKIAFSGYTPIIGNCLFGIYQCRRAQGVSVLEAYEEALRAHIAAIENKNEETT